MITLSRIYCKLVNTLSWYFEVLHSVSLFNILTIKKCHIGAASGFKSSYKSQISYFKSLPSLSSEYLLSSSLKDTSIKGPKRHRCDQVKASLDFMWDFRRSQSNKTNS